MTYLFSALILLLVVGIVIVRAMWGRGDRELGPSQLDADALARSESVYRATAESPGVGWERTSGGVRANALSLDFGVVSDVGAGETGRGSGAGEVSATLRLPQAPGHGRPGPAFARPWAFRLTEDWADHHVQTLGFIAHVRVRADGAAIGGRLDLLMQVSAAGVPIGVVVRASGEGGDGGVDGTSDSGAEPVRGGRVHFDSIEVLRWSGI